MYCVRALKTLMTCLKTTPASPASAKAHPTGPMAVAAVNLVTVPTTPAVVPPPAVMPSRTLSNFFSTTRVLGNSISRSERGMNLKSFR